VRGSMRFVVLVALVATACAFARYSTPLYPAPAGRAASTDVPPNMVTLRILGAELPPTEISGLPWDDDGSPPDAFFRLYIDGERVWESEVIENQLAPRWNAIAPRNVVIARSSRFRLELWDRDTAFSADPLGRLERDGLPATAGSGALARLELERSVVSIQVDAPRAHEGLGLSVELRPDALIVLSVEDFSPAARAGMRLGDRILAIGGARIADGSSDLAMTRLSLAAERNYGLRVAGPDGKNAREVQLDRGYVWLVMPPG
jgi:hypothetical protein